MNERSRLRILQVSALILFLITPLLATTLKPTSYAGGRSRDVEARAVRNSSSLAMILGEIRASMSDLMFVKTELYLHNGVAYMPHIDMEKLSVSGEIQHLEDHQSEVGQPEGHTHTHGDGQTHSHSHDGEHGHTHEDEEFVPTILPTAEQDFRGFLGELERQVKPWKDPNEPHVHTAGTELLPWYRVMTISDPKNVRGYLIGGWWLKGQANKYDEALKFIGEGIENNPEAFQLYYMRGVAELEIAQRIDRGDQPEDLGPSEDWYERATESFLTGARLMAEQRPAGHNPDEPTLEWTNYMEEDARATVRFAVLLLRDRNPQRALEVGYRYDQILGGDGKLKEYLREVEAML